MIIDVSQPSCNDPLDYLIHKRTPNHPKIQMHRINSHNHA